MEKLNAIVFTPKKLLSKSPLLFLHGFMGSLNDWSDDLLWATEHFQRPSIAIDLPGHGKSLFDSPSNYEWSYAIDQIWYTINSFPQFSNEKITPIGYSMGGRFALASALHSPSRINQLLLISSAPGIASASDRATRLQWDLHQAHLLNSLPLPIYLQQWYSQTLFQSVRNQPILMEKILQRRLINSPPHLALSIAEMGRGKQPSLWNQLESAPFPIHLLLGELDSGYIKTGLDMEKQGCIVRRIPEAGHYVHREKETEFRQWLTEVIT